MIPLPLQPLLWETASGVFRSSVSWERTFSTPVVIILALAFVALLYLQWHLLRRRVPTATRLGLCLLRGVFYVLVLGLVLNPTLLIQKVLRILPALAVLVDTSGSMALSDSGDSSRLQQSLEYLQGSTNVPLQALSEHYQLKLYQFADTTREVSLEHLQGLQAQGHSTNIVGALTAVLDDNRSAPPAGMLLLSDGVHHGSDTGLEYVRQAGIPVVAAGLGNPQTYRDILVASVQAPTLTFLHYPVMVQATVQTWGYRNERLAVLLKRAGRVVAATTVQVDADAFEQQVQFELMPEETGDFTYTVSIAPRTGEILTENNHKEFVMSVARDKIRVLLVCGSPTWNYRFLRQAFKSDPSIDLISFVILRTPTDVVNVPESQLSLIPFPTRQLFTQELQNFDLIVFENFSFQFYFPWYYLENVQKYVQEGGAFAMVGGRLAFAQGGYAGTPIEEVLPIVLSKQRDDYRAVRQNLVLTPEGAEHPIMRLSADAAENRRIWASMPELDGLNVAISPKPDATVLGISSDNLDGGQSTPLIAVQRFGEGRSMALLSDYLWKWNFHMAGRMDSNQYYLQFVRQMVRWLIRDPALRQVRVMADGNEFPVGSEITGTVQVLRDDYRPASEATIHSTVRTPEGTSRPLQFIPTENPGEYRYRLPAVAEGFYEIEVQAQVDGVTHDANRLLVRSSRAGGENQQAFPNHQLLRDIAERTGGAFFALHDEARPSIASLVDFLGGSPDYKVLEEQRFRVRETLPWFFAVLACLAVEWWWRRRVGLF